MNINEVNNLDENVFFEIGRISFIRVVLKIGSDGEDFMDSLSKFHWDAQYGRKDWLYLLVCHCGLLSVCDLR